MPALKSTLALVSPALVAAMVVAGCRVPMQDEPMPIERATSAATATPRLRQSTCPAPMPSRSIPPMPSRSMPYPSRPSLPSTSPASVPTPVPVATDEPSSRTRTSPSNVPCAASAP